MDFKSIKSAYQELSGFVDRAKTDSGENTLKAFDKSLEKLGLEIKPIGKNGEETLEQTEFKEMLVEWYFSGNWVIKWEDVD